MTMRLKTIVAGITLMVAASVVYAQSPLFFSGMAKINGPSAPGGSISVAFKEGGLNDGVVFAFTGSFTADYGCVDQQVSPVASNKVTVAGDVAVIATFGSGSKNGRISRTITFIPPLAPSEVSCAGSQVAVLADITYSDLALEDTTNGLFATLDRIGAAAVFFNF